jgi:hypothetical protein
LGWQLIYTGKGNEIEGTALMPHKQRARAVACVNAMAGIPDPDAFVKAHSELVKAAKVTQNHWHTPRLQSALAAVAQQEKPV